MDRQPGEPINLLHLAHRCVARWRHEGEGGPAYVSHIRVGTVDAGWFVDFSGRRSSATAWPDKTTAWQEVRRLMAQHPGEWVTVPCYPTEEEYRRRGWTRGPDGGLTRGG